MSRIHDLLGSHCVFTTPPRGAIHGMIDANSWGCEHALFVMEDGTHLCLLVQIDDRKGPVLEASYQMVLRRDEGVSCAVEIPVGAEDCMRSDFMSLMQQMGLATEIADSEDAFSSRTMVETIFREFKGVVQFAEEFIPY